MRKGWEYKRWKEVLTIINGKNQSAVVDENGEYPIYGSGGIMGYASNWLCPENCVIIGRKGNINKPIFVETKFWNVDTAFGLNANKEYLLPKFLYYFCLDYNFERHNKAVTIPSLTKVDLLKIDIPLPPKSTQLAIVSELDKINELIRLKKEQLKDFGNLAQSLFYEMFGDPVENEKGWEVKKIGDLALVKTGPFGSMLHKEDYICDGIPLVNPVHMKDFKIVPDLDFTISKEKASELENYLLKSNDVVFARRGDIGRCAIVSEAEQGFICGTGSLFVRFSKEIESIFIMYIIRCDSFSKHLISKAKGATMLNINSNTIADLRIPLPPLSLQRLFAQRIEQIEREKSEVQKSIQDLETLLASRMQYWFE